MSSILAILRDECYQRQAKYWGLAFCPLLAGCVHVRSKPWLVGRFAPHAALYDLNGDLNGWQSCATGSKISNPGGYRGEVTSIANLFVYFAFEAKKDPILRPTRGNRETHTPTQD